MPRVVRPGRPNLLQEIGLAAPMGGLNFLTPAVAQPPSDCTFCYNLTARELGLGPRLGSREYVTGLDGPVRTVLSFKGSSPGNDKLFAVTASGIWDCSSQTDAPVRLVAFANVSAESGYGVAITQVAADGSHYLLYTDEANGYFVWSQSLAAWIQPTAGAGPQQVNGATPGNFVFVASWKHHVFMVERNTGRAWYFTTIDGIFGAVAQFNFGSKFRQGGFLVGLWNWTEGGGSDKQDDKLVAVSSGGDVVIYQGSGPGSSDFQICGTWSVGDVPAGRRIATTYGGDVMIISALGAVPLSRLVVGTVVWDRSQYATQKIPTMINNLMAQHKDELGWSVVLSPEDQTLLVLVPNGPNMPVLQLVMNMATRGWSMYRDLNMTAAAAWNGQLYFGTTDGRVMINTGPVDGVTLADPTAFQPIKFSVMTSFQASGSSRMKIVQMIRTSFQNPGGLLNYESAVRYNYNLNELPDVPYTPNPEGGAVWDAARWDQSVWSGDAVLDRRMDSPRGVGPEFAVACRGQAISKVVLLGWHLWFESGGFM